MDMIICDLNKILDLSQRPPQNCPKCGNPADGHYCQGCALLRKKFKEDLFTYCIENEILQDSSKPSNDNTNVFNALQEPFVVNQDPGSHYGYNCPQKVPVVSNPEPCHNQNIDELPQTLPSFNPTCYSEEGNSFTYDSKSNLVHDSPNVFNPPLQPPIYSYEFCGNDAYYEEQEANIDTQPFQYSIIPQPPQEEMSVEFLQEKRNQMDSVKIFLRKFNRISLYEMPKVLSLARETILEIELAFEDKHCQPEDILDESEGIPDNMCDVPFHDNSLPLDVSKDQFEDFSDSNDESTSTDDDSFSIDNIEYVEASPPDSELVSSESSSTSLNSLLEETNTFDNSLPESETFCFDLEEIGSGSTTTHSDISLLEYEAFYDDHVKEISSGRCALLRKKFKEDMFTYCIENGILQGLLDIFDSSNDNTNVVNAPREPFVVKQDTGKNSSQIPPHINHHCCYGCNNSLEDIFCHQFTCEFCEKGAHYGYNCLPKVLIIPNPEPCNNQTIDELPQTLPSFDPTCYSGDGNSFTYDSKSNLVDNSPNVFNQPPQPPTYSYEFCGNDAYYGHDCPLQVPFTYDPEPYQYEDFSESNDDSTLTDDDSFSIDDIEYVEASPPDYELVSLEVMEIVISKVGGIDADILLTIKDDILREKLLNINLLIANIEALKDNPTPYSHFMTKSSSTSLNFLLEETNTFDNSLPESETFCFDSEENSSASTTTRADISLPDYEAFYDDHVKEISSGSTTTHSDFSLYDSFIFDLSINPFPPADRSDFYLEEFADELAHIISPPEHDCFSFKNEPNSGDFTMDVMEDIFLTREPRVHVHNVLPTHHTLQLNLDFILSSESLFAYVVWIFLPFLSYSVAP
nr:hypothetical protein [Tanacetum cinerariifolium]